MPSNSNILSTVRMLQEEKLDLRTITMGINVDGCIRADTQAMAEAVYQKIIKNAGNLVDLSSKYEEQYGVPIVNKRLAVSPISKLLEGRTQEDALLLAETLDSAAAEVGIDLIGGCTTLVEQGMTPGDQTLINALPEMLGQTQRVCGSVNIGSTSSGINVDAAKLVSETVLKLSEKTETENGFGCAKLVIFVNAPDNNPFMAGAFHGQSQPEVVINVGVSGPGVVKRAIERLTDERSDCTLDEIAEEIKHTAYRVTRTGELVGREVANALQIPFGVMDLSLAPTPEVGDSVGEIYRAMGLSSVGGPGSTAAVALLNDAVKKGGAFASSAVGGLSGAFLPVLEDHALAKDVENGELNVEKLEAMTSVCSVGLDMLPLPGDISADTLCGFILDQAAIGCFNNKTTAVRAIPVPGKKAGDAVAFGGLFGSGTICDIGTHAANSAFINRGGHIPRSLGSLTN